MTFIEIRYHSTEEVVLGFTKLQLNLGLDDSIDFIMPLLNMASISEAYLKDTESNNTIKLEKTGEDQVVKSFLLDFLELDKIFR